MAVKVARLARDMTNHNTEPRISRRGFLLTSVTSQMLVPQGLRQSSSVREEARPRLTNPSATAVCGVLSFSTV
jgi:hypothetical protein